MQEFTADEKAVAAHAQGTLIAASTKADGTIVIVVEDGRKLTYTAEQVEAIKAEAKTEPKAKGKK